MPKKPLKAVFDFDDVCHLLNERACAAAGIDIQKVHTFNINDNQLLTSDEKERLITQWNNPELFDNIQWCPGVEEIINLPEYGIEPYINSNCGSYDILDKKYTQIKSKLNLPDDRIILTVIDVKKHAGKNIKNDTTFFSDDNPHHIAESDAYVNLMPEKPWNTSQEERDRYAGKTVLLRKDLISIITTMKTITRHL